MRVRKLSSSGDYTWGQSLQNFYVDVPMAVGQAVETRLRLIQGEWYLDNTAGTPYLTDVIAQSQATADQAIQNEITGTLNVVDIAQYSSSIDPETRKYSVAATVDTAYGQTQVKVTL